MVSILKRDTIPFLQYFARAQKNTQYIHEYPLHLSGWWFRIFFIFTPTWGNDPIWRAYFSNGLKPPTSYSIYSISMFNFLIPSWRGYDPDVFFLSFLFHLKPSKANIDGTLRTPLCSHTFLPETAPNSGLSQGFGTCYLEKNTKIWGRRCGFPFEHGFCYQEGPILCWFQVFFIWVGGSTTK